ncbi:MAG: hypothetical protein ABSG81_16300, partial [Acidimicrobiales bacterium]
MPRPPVTPGDRRLAAWLPDVLGLLWVAAAVVAVLVPALAHGSSLGNFDLLSRYGLSRQPGVTVHYTGPGDQIEQMIPWTTLAWTEVHHGHLPLWNPYSGLGTPLLFNWQAAALSVPTLLGYLFPLRLAYTVVQIATLLIAGSGAYLLGRVLRLGVMGATAAATVFELSGSMTGWLGWPEAGTMAFAGWIFAAGVLVTRGRHRVGSVALLAVALAAALYGGQPETVLIAGIGLVVYLVVDQVVRARTGAVTPVRTLLDLVLAAVAGGALAAPLVLPGLQAVSGSVVRSASRYGALPPHDLVHVLVPGFEGLPVAGSRWFGNSIYPETAAAVGAVAIALGVVAVVTRWRRPEVPAWVAVALVMAALAYLHPLVSALDGATGLSYVGWHRSIITMDLALAVLGGMGLDAVVRSHGERAVRRWCALGFAAVAVVLGLVWLVSRGGLPPAEAAIRNRSFLWPAALVAGGLAVAGLLAWSQRARGRHEATTGGGRHGWWAGAVLLAGETAFLVAAGAPLVSSSPAFVSATPAEATLARIVGGATVGFSTRDCLTPPGVGIHQNANVILGVHELADYDPLTPQSLFRALRDATGRPATAQGGPLVLCPAVTTATTARRFGIGYILVPDGGRRPSGTVFVRTLAGERLYRVPGAAPATL